MINGFGEAHEFNVIYVIIVSMFINKTFNPPMSLELNKNTVFICI